MEKGKAFVVVGHSNWGKSRTLQRLTNDVHQIRWFQIKDKLFFVKRMSNDDNPESLLNFVTNANLITKPVIIIALCPVFDDDSKETRRVLNILKDNYNIFFFVLKLQFSGTGEVTDMEINELRNYGRVFVFNRRVEDSQRALAFQQFIEANM